MWATSPHVPSRVGQPLQACPGRAGLPLSYKLGAVCCSNLILNLEGKEADQRKCRQPEGHQEGKEVVAGIACFTFNVILRTERT